MDYVLLALTIVIGYVCIFSIIDRVCKCIEHCSSAKSFGKFAQIGSQDKITSVDDLDDMK